MKRQSAVQRTLEFKLQQSRARVAYYSYLPTRLYYMGVKRCWEGGGSHARKFAIDEKERRENDNKIDNQRENRRRENSGHVMLARRWEKILGRTGTGRERRDVNNEIMGWVRLRWPGLFYRGRGVDKERVNLR